MSAWGKIEKTVDTVDLKEIMSEEFARDLQNKENEKYDRMIFGEVMKPPNIDFTSNDTGGCCSSNIANDDDIPDDVLQALSANEETLKSDAVIAQILQAQFDLEHDNEVKRVERAKNKDSKVSVSFSKYRVLPEDLIYDSEPEDEPENTKKDWDRFETNDKKLAKIPKRGSVLDEDGERRTKHDLELNGVRNAGKIMSFPPEFQTGDSAGFDMKISNQVFNQLRSYSMKSKKTIKQHDRKENVATAEMGLDHQSRLSLYKLINNQILEKVNGIISTGKEAVILHADSDPLYSGELIIPKECAIKIFSTTLNEYKQRDRYIKDDYRFKDRFSKQNKRTVIQMWAEKEMHNLMRLQKAGILCPDVIIIKKHILIMSFIGADSYAAPKLKDALLDDEQWEAAYHEVLGIMVKLYNDARLVHADLSEYNILWFNNKCYIIDVAQAVEPEHPSALEFLMRDCGNISNFFMSRGVKNVKTKEELFSFLTGLDPIAHNTAMLERLHVKGAPPHMATRMEEEDFPENLKPLIYPFDYAWEKVIESKSE